MLLNTIDTTKEIDEKLEMFYRLHLECPINLTAVKEQNEFYLKHYLDSIYYFKKNQAPTGTLCDIGSGGGFPGIVIAIFYPKVKVTLVESISKKCAFLLESVGKLGLNNVEVLNTRAEQIKGRFFSTITARGVSPVKELLTNTWCLSNAGTRWIMYKGEKLSGELVEAEEFLKKRNLYVKSIRIEEPFTRTYCIISR